MDCYGNFLIEMREHHVYLDERSFFSKIMWGDKLKQERDSKIEAFSKHFMFDSVETVKEIAEIEMCKFELWELYQG